MQLHDLWKVQEQTAATTELAAAGRKPDTLRVDYSEEEKVLTGFIRWLVPRWDEFYLLFTAHGTIDYLRFETFVRWEGKYTGDARQVFAFLDRDSAGHISLRVFLELKRAFESNQNLMHQGLRGLKRLMLGKYGTLARCWRCVFDKEDNHKCCERVFIKCCREHGFTGDVKSTWLEITGGDPQRQITMKDWDPETDTLLTAFCKLLAQRHGKLREGWSAILKHGYGKAGRLSTQEWNDICRGLGFTTKDAKIMFSCLDADQSRTITQDEFLFIRRWDESEKIDMDTKKKDRKTISPMGRPALSTTGSLGASTRSPQASSSSSGPASRRKTGDAPFEGWSSENGSPVSMTTPMVPSSIGGLDSSSPSPGGSAAFEFVVVLSKAEYGEYLKRRREKQIGAASSAGASGGYNSGSPRGASGSASARRNSSSQPAAAKGSRRPSASSNAGGWGGVGEIGV